jgi:ribonuclease HII
MVDVPAGSRFRVGADENGLGPRLGPMVVTAVLARVTGEGWSIAGRAPKGALAQRLGDSKKLVSHGDVELGEAWTRALVARGCGRKPVTPGAAQTPDALIHSVSADDRGELRSPCPSHVEPQCWGQAEEGFVAPDKLVKSIGKDLDRLAEKGVEIVAVRSVILCTSRMNDALMAGKNRFVLDLHSMERLVLELRSIAEADVHAVCGKVGGFGKYSSAFGPLGGRLHSILEESRARSSYHFPGVGEIAFVQDSDASDLCVAMASMVGKYIREALMARIVRFYRGSVPELPDASGYHDPVTATFVEKTVPLRRKHEVPETCFERRRADRADRADRAEALAELS